MVYNIIDHNNTNCGSFTMKLTGPTNGVSFGGRGDLPKVTSGPPLRQIQTVIFDLMNRLVQTITATIMVN